MFDDLFAETETDILNIYGPCYRQSGQRKTQKIHKSIFRENLGDDTDCADVIGIQTLLNSPQGQAKLHVASIPFEFCSDHVADTYVSNANASYWIYPELIK